MGLKDPTVSIVKCSKYHSKEDLIHSVRQAVNYIGGMESIITPGDHVLLKPNLVCPVDYTTGGTTNPHLIFAIADLCREAGAKKITIAEGPGIGEDGDNVFDKLGLREMAGANNCNLVNILKDEFTYVMNPMGKIVKRIRLPKTFIESNVVINIPVMKTHDALSVTLGLKNMKGVIHNSDKKRFHKWGLAQAIVDLGHLVMPELTIVDGTIALEGMGPVVGKPVNLGLVLASTDTVAVDRVCLDIMGFSLEEIDYIRMAGEQGLGCTDLNKIKILGEPAETVKRPFERMSLDPELLAEYGIRIFECDACSGCNNAINSYIYSLNLKGGLEKLRNSTLVFGQTPFIPEKNTGRVIRLGVCTRNMQAEKGTYVPGCPPHPLHIDDYLDGKGLEKA